MRRALAALLAVYLLVAAATRVAEARGVMRCGCSEACWCRKPGLEAFRWVLPVGHR